MVVMWTALATLLYVATMVAHELAHAAAAAEFGCSIAHLGVGVKVWPYWTFPATRARPYSVSVSPWLVAAYVRWDEKDVATLRALPHRDRSWYMNAGVWTNLVLGGVLLAVATSLDGHLFRALIEGAVTAMVAATPRQMCAYVLPVLSIPALALLVWSLASTVGQSSGPVALGRLLVSHNVVDSIGIGGALSLVTALTNLIPLFPLDGGKVADVLITQWWGSRRALVFQTATAAVFVAITLYSVMSDVLWAR